MHQQPVQVPLVSNSRASSSILAPVTGRTSIPGTVVPEVQPVKRLHRFLRLPFSGLPFSGTAVAAEVPESLWLTESLLNSVDVQSGQDDMDGVPRFKRWLVAHGRRVAAVRVTAADLRL